jgi:hypothetical protein
VSFTIYCKNIRLLFDKNFTLGGSIFHNRVDQFVNNYVNGQYQENEIPFSILQQIDLSKNASQIDIINNQYFDKNLGRHNVGEEKGFMHYLYKDKVDLIIIDNFLDLCGTLLWTKDKKYSIFLNHKNTNALDFLTFDKSFMDIESMLTMYKELLRFLKKLQPNAKIVFINFPYLHHKNEIIRNRCIEIDKQFKYHSLCNLIIPLHLLSEWQLAPEGPSHFCMGTYAMYASIIQGMLTNGIKIDINSSFWGIENIIAKLKKNEGEHKN